MTADCEDRSRRGQRSRGRCPVRAGSPTRTTRAPSCSPRRAGTGRPGPDPDGTTHPRQGGPGPADGRQGKQACTLDQEALHCGAVSYDDRVTASSVRPVVLRNGADVGDPLGVVLGFVKAPGRFDVRDLARPASFGEPDLRLAPI